MEHFEKELNDIIFLLRKLCRKLEEIDEKINSGLLNNEILPEYIIERDYINNEIRKMIISSDKIHSKH